MAIQRRTEDTRTVAILSALIISVFGIIAWQRFHADDSPTPAQAARSAAPQSADPEGAVRMGLVRVLDAELDNNTPAPPLPRGPAHAFRILPPNAPPKAESTMPVASLDPEAGGGLPSFLSAVPNAAPTPVTTPASPLGRTPTRVTLDGIGEGEDGGEKFASFTIEGAAAENSGAATETTGQFRELHRGEKLGTARIAAISSQGVLLEGSRKWWPVEATRSVLFPTSLFPASASGSDTPRPKTNVKPTPLPAPAGPLKPAPASSPNPNVGKQGA